MKLEQWCITSADGKQIVFPRKGAKFCVCGYVYGNHRFKDGELIKTSIIKSRSEDIVLTADGAEYKLGQPHPDYAELTLARAKNQKIIDNWSLELDTLGNYRISGKLNYRSSIFGKITAQNGNYVTIGDCDYLVIWQNFSPASKIHFVEEGNSLSYAGINFPENFERYLYGPCRPVLFPHH